MLFKYMDSYAEGTHAEKVKLLKDIQIKLAYTFTKVLTEEQELDYVAVLPKRKVS